MVKKINSHSSKVKDQITLKLKKKILIFTEN